MDNPAYTLGQAVFIRTDKPDYAEEMIPFKNLDELVEICSKSRPNLVLEKIIMYSMTPTGPCAITLGFISASQGQRPGNIPVTEGGES